MPFKSFIMIIEALFMELMSGIEAFKTSFNDWVEGTGSVDEAHVLRTLGDFPASLLDVVRLSIGVHKGDGRAPFLLR